MRAVASCPILAEMTTILDDALDSGLAGQVSGSVLGPRDAGYVPHRDEGWN